MIYAPTEIAAMVERLIVFEDWLYAMRLAGMSDVQPNLQDAAAMLRGVAAERDRYRDLAAKTHKANMATMGAEVKAEAERDRLAAMVEKLRGYAVHDDDCDSNRWRWAGDCTCGLSDVLKESENG